LPVLLALSFLTACAALTPALDPPKVSFVSFRDVTADGGAPTFEIKLKVLNPNEQPLDIAGISYSVFLRDKELITGVANDIPRIEGYGEGGVTVKAGLQLLELLRLLASLGQASSDPLTYRLTAKIDFRGLVPTQRIEETGEFQLN
jgi:LEA14-like dessication related protein